MSKTYTIEQLEQLLTYINNKGMVNFYHEEIQKFLDIVKVRQIKLLPPRDENGRFIKPITNEDIYKKLEELMTKGEVVEE